MNSLTLTPQELNIEILPFLSQKMPFRLGLLNRHCGNQCRGIISISTTSPDEKSLATLPYLHHT